MQSSVKHGLGLLFWYYTFNPVLDNSHLDHQSLVKPFGPVSIYGGRRIEVFILFT